MATEQFSLCWDNFHKNMSAGMQSLLENEDLVDVTLAVEGRYLKAHKMVLSVCSPYFRELFQSSPCKHPIVFMKDVTYIALSDLLQFMYQGEVQVAQENLPMFIKTAEALQVKGLTADNNLNESEAETPEFEKSEQEVVISKSHSSAARHRKPGPACKRPRLSSEAGPATSSTHVKSGTSALTQEELIQFKMEPSESADHSQAEPIDDSEIEKFDDTAGDDMLDDTEDYALMETGDDEPKAGTSADGTGDSQDFYNLGATASHRRKKLRPRTRLVVNGFVYHTSVARSNPPIRYLICSKYGSTGCHARAVLSMDSKPHDLRITRPHNHPPDETAEEKFLFFKQLKEVTQTSPDTVSLKEIFNGVVSMFPEISHEVNFTSTRTSMRRWRKETSLPLF